MSYDSNEEGWRLAQELFDEAAFKLEHMLEALHIEVAKLLYNRRINQCLRKLR